MARPRRRSRARRSRPAGYLITVAAVLGAALISTFVLGRSYAQITSSQVPFRQPYVLSFDPVEDVTLGLPPDSTYAADPSPAAAIRAIEVLPRQVVMLSGGRAVRIINARPPRTLSGLARIIRNRRWIRQSSGTVTLAAAVVVERGASITVAAPVTKKLVLTVRPGVFLAAYQEGRLKIAGVDVRASDTSVPTQSAPPSAGPGRPFLLAAVNSRMTITRSTFSYLGRDWNSSYGVTWTKGSAGSVTNSTFEHDYIGFFANNSNDIRVTHDGFYHCSLYGIDPHSGSSGLLIEYDAANFNGRHGIILAENVTKSTVQHNTAAGNGENGIMMDEASTGNVIKDNVVTGNGSDGVVLADSGDNLVAGNSISGNQVGIEVRGPAAGARITGNTVTANQVAGQGTSLAGNTVYRNGGGWRLRRIGLIWLCALGLLGFLLGITWAMQPRRSRHVRVITAPAQVKEPR